MTIREGRYTLWVCQDCLIAEECPDADDIEPERAAECQEAMAKLRGQGYVGADWSEEPQHQCKFCGHVLPSSQVVATGEFEDEHICPECGEDGLQEREHGIDEFSWRDCDVCGSELGGSRHRYSLFIKEQHGQQSEQEAAHGV